MKVSEFVGKVLTGVEIGDDSMQFVSDDGKKYNFYHSQSCCESVVIDSVAGEVTDLIGYPIVEAEVDADQGGDPAPKYGDSWTWTTFRFRTEKGTLIVKWLGESNGYYSEGVDVCEEGKRSWE